MMARLIRNIRLALKTVLFDKKQYLCFFCGLFIIQMMFSLISVYFVNTIDIRYKKTLEEYDYHVFLGSLNEEQYAFLLSGGTAMLSSDKNYELIRIEEYESMDTYDITYNVYVKFTNENIEDSYNRFYKKQIAGLAELAETGVYYSVSPVYNFSVEKNINTIAFTVISLLMLVLGTFILMVLYYIRISHYKFTYGIYMTFGADLKKLLETSFWELMIVNTMMLPLSLVLSALLGAILYNISGSGFAYSPVVVLITIAASNLIAALSVIWPVWRVSKRTPILNIAAEDNSNLVVSPKMSFEFYGLRYPEKYELFTIWRFRKYISQLVILASVFAILFTGISYIAAVIKKTESEADPQFTLSFNNTGEYPIYYEDELMTQELLQIDNIIQIKKSISISAMEQSSHIIFRNSDVKFGSNFVVFGKDVLSRDQIEEDNLCAENMIKYKACDAEIAVSLNDYKHTGEINSILDNERTVIISDSLNNIKKLKIKPGSKIWIAIKKDQIMSIESMLTGHDLLKEQFKYYNFEYIEFTVGAILHDDVTSRYMNIYFSENDFFDVTGSGAYYNEVNLYTDLSASPAQLSETEYELKKWAVQYYAVDVKNNHASLNYEVDLLKNKHTITQISSVFVILVTPMIWMFSQIIFYGKRGNEFYILEMFGSNERAIKNIFIFDGFVFVILSAVVYTVFELLVNYSINMIFTNKISEIRVLPWFPVLQYIIGLTLMAAFAFGATYFSYFIYKQKKIRKLITENKDSD